MKSDWEEGPQLMPACISKSPLHHYIGEPNSFWAEYKKECWNYLNNTEYKYTDDIEKQKIPKNPTLIFREGAEEGLWISRSLIPLIRLAFSLQSKLPQYTFPIWFIPAASVTFISLCRCSNSHPRHHQHHCIKKALKFRPGPSFDPFQTRDLGMGIGGGWGLNLNLYMILRI